MAPWVKWPTSKSRTAYCLLTVCEHFVERSMMTSEATLFCEDNENARSYDIFYVSCLCDVIYHHQKIVV